MILTKKEQDQINALIRQNQRFAIWRIPGEKFHFIRQVSSPTKLLYNIEELDALKGFIIAPFVPSEKHAIVVIKKETDRIDYPVTETKTSEEISNYSETVSATSNYGKEDYMKRLDHFITSLQNNEYDKLVLSRQLIINKPDDFSAAGIFCDACEHYAYSYIYLCHTPETGTWLGCTPEILISSENDRWHTVALAGTQPLKNGEIPHNWDTKNRKEQEYVASYIRKRLHSFGIQPEETPAHPIQAAALSHLKSDFYFTLPEHVKLGQLLQSLHPTPAVCGLPKEESFKFVLKNEGYDRSYYTGFIGWMDPEQRSDLYVNLRCMNIRSEYLILYAGGGILASSEKESEWAETKAKMQTMGRILNIFP